MEDGRINIRATLDINEMERNAERYRKELARMGTVTDQSGQVISTAWSRMKQAATAYFSIDIIKRIAQTRGEFQQLEVAFKTLLGAEEPAMKLMNQLVETAAKTPFDLKGVSDGARQLLAYGFAAENVNDTLIRLGNVAAGLGLPLERLTYLYGTTAVQGRLYARDMLQFQSSGIPVLQELSKMYGKTTSEINDMVTAGKIGFEDVKKVFEGMTNEGGKFYNLMEEQSKTITGQISNLGDAIDTMFNNIGKANQGTISNVISGATYLVENYEKVLSILKVLVATYGTYKASLIAVAAAQRLSVTIQNISAWLSLAKTIRTAKDAQIAFNLATKANPYVLLATVIIGVGTALYQFTKKTEAATEALKKFNEESKKQADDTQAFITIARDETQSIAARQLALNSLRKLYPDLFNNMDLEAIKTANLTELNNELAKATRERLKAQAEESIKETEKSINAIKQQIDFLNKNAVQGRGERLIKANKQLQELQDKLAGQHSILNKVNSDIKAQEDAERRAKEEAEAHAKSVEKTVKWYEEQIKTLKEAQETSTTNKQFNDYQRQIDQLTKEKEAITGASKATQKAEEERIKIIEQIDEELLSLRKQNQQTQIDLMQEGTEKELAQIQLDYHKKIDEIKKLADDWAVKQGGTLTTEQTVQISTAYSTAKQKREQDASDVYKKQTDELNELLKQYKSYQQQRLDTERKYNKDIERLQEQLAKTTEENERNKLEESIRTAEQKKKNELSGLDLEEFQKEIDWTSVFGNLDKLSTNALQQLKNKIKEYLSAIGDGISKEDFKTVVDTFEKLDIAITERHPIEGFINSLEDYRLAAQKVAEAQKKVNDLQKKGSSSTNELEKATKELSDAQNTRRESLLKMTQAVNAIGEKGNELIQAGNNITDMLTSLGIKIPESISDTLTGLGQITSSLDSIDLTKPFSVITGVTGIIAGLGKTIGGIFGGNRNKAAKGTAKLEETTKRIAETNEIINSLIEKRIELIKKASAEEQKGLTESSLNAIDIQKKRLEIEFSKLQTNRLLAKGGKNNDLAVKDLQLNTIEDLKNFLSSEKLLQLESQGYSLDNKEKWQQIVNSWDELNGKAEELRKIVSEANTGLTFEDAKNGLDDLLLSADTTYKDISKNFEGYMRNSVLKMVKSRYLNEAMQKWYDNFADMTSDQILSDTDVTNLRNEYENIYNEAQNRINTLLHAAGLSLEGSESDKTERQTGTISETITEQTASETMGIWRGQYDVTKGIQTEVISLHADWKNAINITNNYLSAITDNTGTTANNTAILSVINDNLERMDGRLRTLETNSNKKYI